MKKITIFVVIFLILLSLGITFFVTNKKLSKDEFITLMKSFENISNVKLEGTSTKYIKDGNMLVIEENDVHTWSNSKTKECIRYIPSAKQYALIDYGESGFSELKDAKYTFIRL